MMKLLQSYTLIDENISSRYVKIFLEWLNWYNEKGVGKGQQGNKIK